MNELTIPGQISLTSLVLPPDLPYREWQGIGDTLQSISRAHQWWLGDWLLYGERHYGDKYAQAVELTGLSYGTIANVVWTARNVIFTQRRENLSFAHHSEVAPLEPDDQDRWLALAESNGWNRDELRNEIRKSRQFAPLNQREELERANGRLRERNTALTARLAAIQDEAARACADPGAVAEAANSVREGWITCPHCGGKFYVD